MFDFTTNFVCIIYIFKMHKYYIVYTFFRKMCDVIQQSQDYSNLLVLVFLRYKSIIFRVSCERKLSRNFAFFRENELNEKMRKRSEISQKTITCSIQLQYTVWNNYDRKVWNSNKCAQLGCTVHYGKSEPVDIVGIEKTDSLAIFNTD